MEGKLAKDLTEGEVEDIFYSNNTYHVISKTGYYYTLNDSFEYVKEPKKMLEDTYTAIDIGPNVTEFSMDLTYYYIPTNQFAPDQDLSTVATQGNLSTVNGKVATVIQSGMTKLIILKHYKKYLFKNRKVGQLGTDPFCLFLCLLLDKRGPSPIVLSFFLFLFFFCSFVFFLTKTDFCHIIQVVVIWRKKEKLKDKYYT